MFYVYVYFDPTTSSTLHPSGFEPFYVGKGKNDRVRHHLFESNIKGDKNKHKTNKIKKLLSNNIQPFIEIVNSNLTEHDAFELEKQLIIKFGRADLGLGPLTNLTDGGDGASGKIFSTEYRKKLSDAAKKVKMSDETKRKISTALTGRTFSKETNLKRANTRRGKKLSNETKRKISAAHHLIRQTEEWKQKASKSQLGKKHTLEHIQKSIINNPRSKPVEVFGIKYISRNQAIKETGLTPSQLQKEKSFKFL